MLFSTLLGLGATSIFLASPATAAILSTDSFAAVAAKSYDFIVVGAGVGGYVIHSFTQIAGSIFE